MTSHLLLSSKQIQLIKTLKWLIYDQNVIFTWRQIRAINKKTDADIFNLQTTELIQYIENQNGVYFLKEEQNQKNKKERIALLTFTIDDIVNLRLYGDVIFVDGTNVPNKLI